MSLSPNHRDQGYSEGFSDASKMLEASISANAARLREMETVLRQAADLLGLLARPDGRPESLSHIWARCVEIEAKARAAIGSTTSVLGSVRSQLTENNNR